LAPHKIPRTIVFLDELPKTGSDKIDRRRLRELSLQKKDATFDMSFAPAVVDGHGARWDFVRTP